ncbi:MAG: hypothetical protein P8172_10260 [Gammaproteobacteria bacterium]
MQPMRVRATRIAALLLSAALLPGVVTADTNRTAPGELDDAVRFASPAAHEAGTLGFQLLPARFRHGAWHHPGAAPTDAAGRDPRLFDALDFRDRSSLITRIRELDAPSLLTFLETRAFTVFLGFSAEGIPVLNIISRRSERAVPDSDDKPLPPAHLPEATILAAAALGR